uniref:Uncharacterized protein n=1 Tax=Anguilla anguilla TaxID=7936 RepID=A0A0E9XHY5_ANGAN
MNLKPSMPTGDARSTVAMATPLGGRHYSSPLFNAPPPHPPQALCQH